MPRGGARIGAGRPRGSATRKSREIANAAIVRGCKLPLEYMLAVIEDETAAQTRRDQMAIAAAPYVHPRLSAVQTNNTNVNHKGGDTGIINIFAVPRGAHISKDGEGVTIEGESVALKPLEPFVGTPPLLADQRDEDALRREPVVERHEVIEVDVSNVTILRRRDEDGGDQGPGAA